MSNGVIDLRKQNPASRGSRQPTLGQSVPPSRALPAPHALPLLPEGFDLEWSAYEHEYRIRGPYWFLYPLVIATLAIVFGVLTHDYLFIAFVVLSFVILNYYARRAPRLLAYRIEKRGVWTENKLMDFGRIKSFRIFTHPLMAPELLLETGHPISPITRIRLENISPDAVRNVMSRYLPEKEQKDLATDQIARIIGF